MWADIMLGFFYFLSNLLSSFKELEAQRLSKLTKGQEASNWYNQVQSHHCPKTKTLPATSGTFFVSPVLTTVNDILEEME